MRSILVSLRAPFASTVSALLLAATPALAYAAEQLVRQFEPASARFWITAAVVQMLTLWGYLARSLPAWSRWRDGTALDRLTILQGVVIASLGGNIAYYGGYYGAGFAELYCLIAAAIAGYGGDKFLTPLLTRVTGKIP